MRMIRPKIIIVNENDKIIEHKQRGTLSKNDIYRVSALWITNSKNQILLAKRHRNKTHHPEQWGPAVAGTVEEGETYRQNIIKETEEEVGVKNITPKLGPKTKTSGKYNHFTQWYTLTLDKNTSKFKIQEDEVEEIKWFDKEKLETNLKNSPEEYLPRLKKYFMLFSN